MYLIVIMCMKEIFDHLLKQRKLGQEQKREACSLLTMKVNKKLLQWHVSSTTGKVVTLKDISNIQSEVNCANSNSDLDVVTCLRANEDSSTYSYVHAQLIYHNSYTIVSSLKF